MRVYHADIGFVRPILRLVWIASVAISAAVFVAALLLGTHSHFRYEQIRREASADGWSSLYAVAHLNGSLVISGYTTWSGPDTRRGGDARVVWERRKDRLPVFHFTWAGSTAGFAYEHRAMPPLNSGQRGFRVIVIAVPYWFVALFASVLPAIALIRWREKRRIAREGLCPVCGYDLRASVERCPECGTAIEHANASVIRETS